MSQIADALLYWGSFHYFKSKAADVQAIHQWRQEGILISFWTKKEACTIQYSKKEWEWKHEIETNAETEKCKWQRVLLLIVLSVPFSQVAFSLFQMNQSGDNAVWKYDRKGLSTCTEWAHYSFVKKIWTSPIKGN